MRSKDIKLSKGQSLSISSITRMIMSARGSYDYIRIVCHNGKYITVSFFRDNSFEIGTNSRDYEMINDIKILKVSYTTRAMSQFIFKWVNKLNK